MVARERVEDYLRKKQCTQNTLHQKDTTLVCALEATTEV
jgi:hypothetical protein